MTAQPTSAGEALAREMCEWLGYSPDELIEGQPRWQLYKQSAEDVIRYRDYHASSSR